MNGPEEVLREMSGIEKVLWVLERADFVRLARPLTVAGVEFEFEAAARGTGASHDLVVVATAALPPRRLLRLVSVLARTLDVAESRRPVTAIVLGSMSAPDKSDLERHARVLTLESAEPSIEEVERAAAVLMPLTLPALTITGGSPVEEVLKKLGAKATDEHLPFIDAATGGPERVKATLRAYIDAVVPDEEWRDD
jgi:hypothetical protein